MEDEVTIEYLYKKKREKYYLCIPWPRTRQKLRFCCAYLLSTFLASVVALIVFAAAYYSFFLVWNNNSSKNSYSYITS